MLSDSLKRKLDILSSSPITFNEQGKYFALRLANGVLRPKKGLTGILAREFTMPSANVDEDAVPHKKARRSRKDPVPTPVLWRRPMSEIRAAMAPLNCAASCTACSIAMQRAAGALVVSTSGDWFNRWHGSEVDRQLSLYVKAGSRERFAALVQSVDPCVATLLHYFDTQGVAIVAAQVPLYSEELGIATSFDVVGTDRATRTQFLVYEIKANVTGDDTAYVKLRARQQRGAARSFPLSFHCLNQMQVWCQHHMLTKRLGAPPDAASVLRVSPGFVRNYALNPYYHERAQNLVRSLRQKGSVKRPRALTAARQRRQAVAAASKL